jgi:hypothetical protein
MLKCMQLRLCISFEIFNFLISYYSFVMAVMSGWLLFGDKIECVKIG